jgi:hypothetical protein
MLGSRVRHVAELDLSSNEATHGSDIDDDPFIVSRVPVEYHEHVSQAACTCTYPFSSTSCFSISRI